VERGRTADGDGKRLPTLLWFAVRGTATSPPAPSPLVEGGRTTNGQRQTTTTTDAGKAMGMRGGIGLGVLGILALVSGAVAEGEAAAVLTLRAAVSVAGESFALGDIAGIEGEGSLQARLAGVIIGPSPLSGDSRQVSAGYVKLRLRREGIDLAGIEVKGDGVRASRVGGGTPTKRQTTGGGADKTAPEEAPVVRRGDTVEVVVRVGPILVKTPGRALGDAAVGGVVRVQIPQTNATLNAIATGVGQCQVLGDRF